MKRYHYDCYGKKLLYIDDAEPVYGRDFCDACGDCLPRYGEDSCALCEGGHRWVVYELTDEEAAGRA